MRAAMASRDASPASVGRTLFDKIWANHLVLARDTGPQLMYIDRHILHDGSFHAFRQMRARGLAVRHPDPVFGVPAHSGPTTGRRIEPEVNPEGGRVISPFDGNKNGREHCRAREGKD